MFQIVKIHGIRPTALLRLHALLEEEKSMETEQEIAFEAGDAIGHGKRKCAELLSSKLEEGNTTYRVEIKIWMVMPCLHPDRLSGNPRKDGIPAKLYPSRKMLLSIYEAIGVYPKEEQLIKLSET